jgi:transposase
MTQYQFVGVDVAKDKFDAALEINNISHQNCFANNKKGYREFSKWLNKYTKQPWVCMEATGHYSELIADYLFSQQVQVSVVNPLQIKSFARARLSRNKTDQLDARIIANYCEVMRPRIFYSRSESHKELKDLTNLLDTLKAQHVQLSNQLHSAQSNVAKLTIRKLLKTLEKEIARVEKQIEEIIKSNSELDENMKLMTSIQGVGKLTAFKVLSHVPDMNRFANAKQFAAFIGISPRQHQSGNFHGKTTISRLGDARLRKTLYMAALVAKRFNKRLQPFVTRLQNKGKAPKSIICAVMRKLAHLIFGVLKNRRPFDVNFA